MIFYRLLRGVRPSDDAVCPRCHPDGAQPRIRRAAGHQEEGADGIARVAESNLVDGVIILDVKRRDPRVGILSDIRQPGVLIGMPDGEPAADCVDFGFGAAGSERARAFGAALDEHPTVTALLVHNDGALVGGAA